MTQLITALTWQKKNKNRINVDLNGKYAFGISSNLASNLFIGKELPDSEIVRLCRLDQYEIAYGFALRLLSYRIRSCSEIKDRLRKKGFDQGIVDETIDRLKKNGFISDEKFASEWVENRSTFRPRSHRFLEYELKRKGVSPDIILQALSTAPDNEILALQAGRKYALRLSQLEFNLFKSRLSGFLLRRGFNYGIVENVVRKIWQENESTKGK